jgi:CRISPR-associated protein Csm3
LSGGESPLWAGLVPVVRSVRIEFSLRNLEPLRIGVGRGGDRLGEAIDLPVYRQKIVVGNEVSEEPLIPGSSMKGVLRTATMALASSCGIEAHSGVGDDNCIHRTFGTPSVFDRWRSNATPSALRRLLASLCPACLLYGAPSVASRVVVGDFVPVERPVLTGVKTGVAINRRTGTAHKGALYTVEYVEPGTVFRGYISAVNTPNWLLSLLAASILYIADGCIKIGGFKSRGMGLVGIVEDSVKITISDPGAKGRLKILDKDIDEEEELKECSWSNGVAACSGVAAYNALRRIASLWQAKYCRKAAPVVGKRLENLRAWAEGAVEV